jgi:putative ABC transport system permease protein
MLSTIGRMAARVAAFFRRRDLDTDLDQELESHLDMLAEDNVRRGMAPAEARRAALIRLGGTAALKEQHRDARALPGIDALLQDLRFAFRLILRDPWFSAAAISALALGIGANTVGFTIVNAAFLRGLPFEDSNRLHIMSWQNRSGRRSNVSHAELLDWRAQSRTFASLAAYGEATLNISDDSNLPEQAHGTAITANAFGVLRQQPLVGRDFTAGDERPGAEPVVIIGYTVWQNRYGRDPDVVGRSLRVNGQPATIVGVMPEGMRFPDDTQIWMPLIPPDGQAARTTRALRVFGRLADGTDRRQAQAEMAGIAQQLMTAFPEATKDLLGVRVETFPERFIGGAGRPMMYTVMGAVSFVLLIACANVANLLLARSAYRAREIAIRAAMGATRWRIVRQLLIESIVLGLIGGTIGLPLAISGVQMFSLAVGQSLPYWVAFTVDYTVFAYVAVVCVLTGVLFGMAPALHVSKTNQQHVLKDGGRGSAGSRRVNRFSTALVVSELALTLVLLVGTGSMIRSFMTLYTVELGISIDGLMAMEVPLPASRYGTADARRAFFDELERRVGTVPGVEAAAITTGVPPLDGGERIVEIEGRPQPQDTRPVFVGTVTISPPFFDAVGVRLIRGRHFSERDGAPGAETVIVNEQFAHQFFPGEDPIGRRLRFTERQRVPRKPEDVWRTIVGVSPLIKQGSPTDAYINSVVYIPYRQEAPASASLLVRSALPPGSVMDAVRHEVQSMDRDQPVLGIQTLAQVLANDRWWQRTWSGMFGAFSTIALVLSSLGLYSVMAYSVARRTQEIGVRMTLGANRRQVSSLVLRRGFVQVAIGLALGFAGSWVLRRVLAVGGLVGISPHDPIALAAIAGLLTAACVAACLLPARRATQVDPVVALRAE